ncbi:peptidase [Cellulomonas sp. ATA003]|uniref:peptidase n=1 Tax=Cellulomonas sp. ATA003 TaxID=3073064 RepID=UPI0028736C0C|nr:peptidase [Cellulomonas sp. ATA003]WNB85214.1 peptidase [Cellulomonas sp. ATA003]
MTRRTALVAAAAAALVLAPTAAMAYDAPGFSSTVSDPTPVAGAPIAFAIAGNTDIAGKTVLLTVTSSPASIPNSAIQIAGTATATKVADANGDVKFSVTLSQAGSYDAVATVDGQAISTQALAVAAGSAAGSSAAGSAAAGSKSAAGAQLADTGFDGADLAAGAGALMLAGAGAVLIAKRRQSAQIGA